MQRTAYTLQSLRLVFSLDPRTDELLESWTGAAGLRSEHAIAREIFARDRPLHFYTSARRPTQTPGTLCAFLQRGEHNQRLSRRKAR